MHLTDLNPHGGIGANAILLEIGHFRVLIDCGLHPKHAGRTALPDIDRIGDDSLDLILLTHCHLDHLGALPIAARYHPRAEILASIPSCSLAVRMMRNSVQVMTRQREELNIPEYPLYTHSELRQMEDRFEPISFSRPRAIRKHGEELVVTLYPAGHVPGAASIRFDHPEGSILFTGDLLFTDQEILPGAALPRDPVDHLVLETTRGLQERHAERTREAETDSLITALAETLSAGGSCLLPVFAFGRMQEIFAILHRARKKGRLPNVPIHSSGLGMDIVNYFDAIAKRTGLLRFNRRIVRELRIRPIPPEIFRMGLPAGPAIYVASSGMIVENTPSYNLSAALLPRENGLIAFVGYCDPDAFGYRVLTAQPDQEVVFEKLDRTVTRHCRIERFDLSGHADRDELMDLAFDLRPRNVVLTHGDPDARTWFADEFKRRAFAGRVIDPEPLKRFEI